MSKVIAVDVGGTFTDVVCVEDGRITTAKAPTNPQASELSVLAAAGQLGLRDADVFNLASTAGLNAVLTRRLPKVGFLTTYGHRDILDQGSVMRPLEALTDPTWRRSFGDAGGRPLVSRYLRRGVRERLRADGSVLFPLDEDQAREELALLRRCNVEGIAICLLHAPRNEAHERRLRELAREELGDLPCSISSETSPLIREQFRATTTVIDVIMKVFYGAYDARLESGLTEAGFKGRRYYSDCAANLLPRDYAMERPYQLVLGGPAGGAVSAAHFGRAIGDENLLCADVGGTSVDISLIFEGQPWSSNTFEIEHDLLVNATSINIVTLGAGGGSIISATPAGDIATGPDSAGAVPGPACYDAGGLRPTVTDAALAIGILSEDGFLGGKKALRRDLALQAFADMDSVLPVADRIRSGWRMAVNNIAEGLLNIAIGRGIDARDFSLVACGAAGPMLLPCVMDDFPVRRVVVPPYPGLFSAVGLVSTDRVYTDRIGRYLMLDASHADELDELYRRMEGRLRVKIGEEEARQARLVRTFDARFMGQSWDTPLVAAPSGRIDAAAVETMLATFRQTYEKLNGNRFDQLPVEALSYRVQLVLPAVKVDYPTIPALGPPTPSGEVLLRHLSEAPQRALEYRRETLGRDATIKGPAVIREDTSTTFVPDGRTATIGACGEITIA